jgi:hypothetical protein
MKGASETGSDAKAGTATTCCGRTPRTPGAGVAVSDWCGQALRKPVGAERWRESLPTSWQPTFRACIGQPGGHCPQGRAPGDAPSVTPTSSAKSTTRAQTRRGMMRLMRICPIALSVWLLKRRSLARPFDRPNVGDTRTGRPSSAVLAGVAFASIVGRKPGVRGEARAQAPPAWTECAVPRGGDRRHLCHRVTLARQGAISRHETGVSLSGPPVQDTCSTPLGGRDTLSVFARMSIARDPTKLLSGRRHLGRPSTPDRRRPGAAGSRGGGNHQLNGPTTSRPRSAPRTE